MARRTKSARREGAKRNGKTVTPHDESDRCLTDGQNGNTVKVTERYCYKRSAWFDTCIDSRERRMLVDAIHERIEATPTRWLAELLVDASRWAEDEPVTEPFVDHGVDGEPLGDRASILLMKGDVAESCERMVYEESSLFNLMSFDKYKVEMKRMKAIGLT